MAAHGGGGGRSRRPPVAAINLHPPSSGVHVFPLRPSHLPNALLSPSSPPPPSLRPARLFRTPLGRRRRLLLPPCSSSPSRLSRLSCACAACGEVPLLSSVMEGKNKKQSGSSSSPPKTTSSSSSLAADLFGGKNAPNPSSSSFFHSVFPPPSTVMGRDSSRSDIFSSSWKQDAPSQTWNAPDAAADGMGQGSGNRERNSAYQHEKIDPCSFSSSLYYGGQDICTSTSGSHNNGYNRKKDGEDDTNNPNAVSRGNWWQGSLYY